MLPFAALADPVRRAIVERLAEGGVDGEVGAGELAAAFPVSRPAVSRHLRVLREAGLVHSRVAAQERLYRLDRAPLDELATWLERFSPPPARGLRGPGARLDALDTELHRGRRARRAQEQDQGRDHDQQGDDHDDRTG